MQASAPHTNKQPAECLHCGSHAISRKGVRKKKLEIVQLWRCASCKRTFTPGPAALRNKTYPIRTVLQALTLYDLGYSLNETAKRLTRISHEDRCIGALNQRKFFCNKGLSWRRGAPRCRQSVIRIPSISPASAGGLSQLRSTAAR